MTDIDYAKGVGFAISTANMVEEILGEMSPEQRHQVEAHILIAIAAAFDLRWSGIRPGQEHGRRLRLAYDKNREGIARYLASEMGNPDHPGDPKPVKWPTLEI